MPSDNLDKFGAFQKANELFDLCFDDMGPLARNPLCMRLVSQQIAAADSICANIEEGYGRASKREFAQFLVIARGSTREVRGRYRRMHRWLSPEQVEDRTARCSEILTIITRTITRLRSS
jgi:four helix bundle protein